MKVKRVTFRVLGRQTISRILGMADQLDIDVNEEKNDPDTISE